MITEDDIKAFVESINHPFLLLLLDRVTKERLEKVGVAMNRGNPVGEYAEYLVATAFGGKRMPNANEGYDITLKDGTKIEVKGRIFEGRRVPRSDVKNSIIESEAFDFLVYVVFNENMMVKYALKISFVEFLHLATYCEHRNSTPKWRFSAHPNLLNDPRITNITEALHIAEIDQDNANMTLKREAAKSRRAP